jgi:hypothetical protein
MWIRPYYPGLRGHFSSSSSTPLSSINASVFATLQAIGAQQAGNSSWALPANEAPLPEELIEDLKLKTKARTMSGAFTS